MAFVSHVGGSHVFVVESVVLLGKLPNEPPLGSSVEKSVHAMLSLPEGCSCSLASPAFCVPPGSAAAGFPATSHSHWPWEPGIWKQALLTTGGSVRPLLECAEVMPLPALPF